MADTRAQEARRRAEKLLALTNEHVDEIIETLCYVETYQTAQAEIEWTRYALSNIDRLIDATASREPIGQLAVYMPFNVPFYTFYLYAVAPMLAGNRVVVHHSSATGWIFEPIMELVGDALEGRIEAPEIPRSAFTEDIAFKSDGVLVAGDWTTGQYFMERTSADVALLYQGAGVGNCIVTPTADLKDTVEKVFRGKLFNSGQDCCALECFYAHEDVVDEFVDLLVERVKRTNVGDNSNPATDVGRLTRPEQAEALLGRYRDSSDVEAILPGHVEGGTMYPGVYRMTPNAELLRVEKFCPLFAVTEYESEDALVAELSDAPNRMITSIFGEPGRFVQLEGRFGHTVYGQTIYDCEEPHEPFGGYGRSTFSRRPNRPMRDGPMYIPLETTLGS